MVRKASKSDFVKATNKVGARKVPTNETRKDSVAGKSISLPSQSFSRCETLTDMLHGLRHHSPKKRLESINQLIRRGADFAVGESLKDVLLSVSILLSDPDKQIRAKASNYLATLLSLATVSQASSLYAIVAPHIGVALGNVDMSMRGDAIAFLTRLPSLCMFGKDDLHNYLRCMIEMRCGSNVSFGQSGASSTTIPSHSILECIEKILLTYIEWTAQRAQNRLDPFDWNIKSIWSRLSLQTNPIEAARLILILRKQGESKWADRIEALLQSDQSSLVVETSTEPMTATKDPISVSRNSKSVFALLANYDSD